MMTTRRIGVAVAAADVWLTVRDVAGLGEVTPSVNSVAVATTMLALYIADEWITAAD
jgi:hypothetical protein